MDAVVDKLLEIKQGTHMDNTQLGRVLGLSSAEVAALLEGGRVDKETAAMVDKLYGYYVNARDHNPNELEKLLWMDFPGQED